MRKYIDILSEAAPEELKTKVIDLVKQTEDPAILQKVLTALKSTDLSTRLADVFKTDADASKLVDRLANLIIHVEGTVDEKESFANDYKSGFIDTGVLLDGQQHTFEDFVKPGFPLKVFNLLAIELTAQGVGPGEMALAIMSPQISHSGRKSGGGDLNIAGKAVEVKTTVSRGGRWLDTRKADLDMQAIKKELTKALEGSDVVLPPRLGISMWLTQIKPILEQKPEVLDHVVKTMAKGMFSKTNTDRYEAALKGNDASEIVDALLATGYENYKSYAGFDGMLMVDVRGGGTAQYFNNYDEMKGKVKPATVYLYAPESEAMPQVELIATVGGRAKAPASAPAGTSSIDFDQKVADLSAPTVGIRPKGVAKPDQPREPSPPRELRS